MPKGDELAHTFDHDAFVEAYDKTTGKKVGRVPKTHLKIFPNLSPTPKAKAQNVSPKFPDFIEKEG